jgi:4-amino-4-deoxy-L-arabinose transferase-like glycosyltransferase
MNVPANLERRAAAVAAILVAFAVVRMASTFRLFSATVDEATHISASLEIYQFHQYKVQRENPPVPRVVMGLAPYLGGMRFDPAPPWPLQLKTSFYDHGKYEHNLFLARLGNLFFFMLSALAVWLLARDDLGKSGALMAVLLFTMEPIVMGYSTLATHDASAVAGLVVPLLAFRRWLREPALGRALLFGAAYGFGIACKFSSIVFVPLACIVMTIVQLLWNEPLRRRFLRAVPAVVPAALVTLLTVWASYGFVVGPRSLLTPYEGAFGPRTLAALHHIGSDTRIPAPNFFIGIAALILDGRAGIQSYLCGRTSTSGWWWYFPFAVVLKTTIALLLLCLAGAFVTRGALRWTWLEWFASAVAMLAIAMTSPLDIGVRYVLPIYAPIALAGAAAAMALLRGGHIARALAVALVALQIGASLFAHPDYFPYFNLFAGREPSRYLGDSNLDWGQDVLRLRNAVRAHHVTEMRASLMGAADFEKLGFPTVGTADPWQPSPGWLAVSEQSYAMARTGGGWLWLPPAYEHIGKSIRLYSIPGPESPAWAKMLHDYRIAAPFVVVALEHSGRPVERILLPVAGSTGPRGAPGGVWWNVAQSVRNDGPKAAIVHAIGCAAPQCELELAPGKSMPLSATGSFLIVYVEKENAGKLTFTTIAERTAPDGTKTSMPMPSVPERDFRTGTSTIENVPFDEGLRLNLRAWSAGPHAPALTVRVTAPDGHPLGEKQYGIDSDTGYSVSPDLRTDFPNVHGRNHVVLDAGNGQVWGFVSVNDPKVALPTQLYP